MAEYRFDSEPRGVQVRRAVRDDLLGLPVEVAPRLLGGVIITRVDDALVAARITEVEAYHGLGTGSVADPGCHARMGVTERNRTLWAEAGRLYVYLSHGIHSCVNVVCGPEGVGGGVLLRSAEIVAGADIAAARRNGRSGDLARGPGKLGQALALTPAAHDGMDALTGRERAGARALLWLAKEPDAIVRSGPRVGVAGIAGTSAYPWRFWIDGDRNVSAFRWGRGAAEIELAGVGELLPGEPEGLSARRGVG